MLVLGMLATAEVSTHRRIGWASSQSRPGVRPGREAAQAPSEQPSLQLISGHVT
jgi:hypothetical protein